MFKQLEKRDNPGIGALPSPLSTPEDAALYLATLRNDLEAPAMALEPAIGAALSALASLPLCLLSRMSGSGATCVALFPTREAARTAARMLAGAHPGWWICDTVLT